MGEGLESKQRWKFRMKDSELHSSSDNSKSSCEPVLNKNKLAPGVASCEDDETSGIGRLLQENGNREPSGTIKQGKTRTKRRRNQNSVGELQGGALEEAGPKTGKARTNDAAAAAMENAKKLVESLFDDLKVATENLFRWMGEEMHKLFEDQIGLSQARRKRQKRNPDVKVKKPLKQPAAHMKQPVNLQEKKPRSYDLQSPDNLIERSSAAKTSDLYNSLEEKNDKGKKIPFLAGSRSQTSPTSADQNLQLQTQSEKTVVLAIEAQNSNIEKPPRRKRAVDRHDHFPVNDKKIPETSPEQSFVSNPAHLPTSSSHPTSLTDKKAGFFLERPNQMLDLNAFRGYYPRLQPEDRSLGCCSTQPKPRNLLPNFSQISSPSSSSMGPGFLVPHHPGMDVGCSLANQVNQVNWGSLNGNTMDLTMNEGAIQFSGGNYSLLEHFVAKHQHGNMHSGYNPEGGRLLSYQIPNIREGPHFSK